MTLPRATRGGQPRYSALAITTALTLRAVFRLALRQTEGLIASLLRLLGLDLAAPDHLTISRRGETLPVSRPRPAANRFTCWSRSRHTILNLDLTAAQHDELRAAALEGVTGDRVHVGVVGAADLAAMLNDLSHLRSAFFATGAFRTWGESWNAHQHVSAFAQTSLIGREDVLATLQTWIEDPAVRVIALSGTHMMGKSRVALEATRQRDTAFVEALDRQTLNIDHLRRLTSPGRVALALVNDPDAELAEELARETLATDGLKLILSLSTADAAPAPSLASIRECN